MRNISQHVMLPALINAADPFNANGFCGKHGLLVGLINGEIPFTRLSEVVSQPKPLNLDLLDLARVLSRYFPPIQHYRTSL